MINESSHPAKILIIDDEAVIRQSFVDHLEDLGYQTLTAENGLIGLDIIEHEQPDLALTDLRMPEMGGLEVIERGRQLAPDIPIIVVSGAGRIGDAIQALRLGAWDYILKPVDEMSVLEYRVEKTLEKARLIRENRMYQENLERMVRKRTAELEQANTHLSASEERYHNLVDSVPVGIYRSTPDGRLLDGNPALLEILGYPDRATMLAANIKDLFFEESDREQELALIEQGNVISHHRMQLRRYDGTTIWVLDSANAVHDSSGQTVHYYGRLENITEQVRAEDALRESEEKYRSLTEQSSDAIYLLYKNQFEIINPRFTELFGISPEEARSPNFNFMNLVAPKSREFIEERSRKLAQGQEIAPRYEFTAQDKDGNEIEVGVSASYIPYRDGMATQGTLRDITERVQAEAAVQQYVRRLDALHQIDQAITSSLDIKATLNVLLDHLLAQLEVDAAAVLRYQKDLQVLVFFQGQGLRTAAHQYPDLRLGQGYAGEAALQRHNIYISDLNHADKGFLESPWVKEEGFSAYYGIPLIAKGALVGVLEVFHRSALDPDNEWLDFLEVLAGQAAIAIDNAALFNDLQRSNVELALAYDATIEGWAHALEIRDMETEGHSRRVVALTIKLAHNMGINGQDLTNLRWGALLHDIGKMGVPDRILQKPGPLTEEEWRIMRKHPVYAYEWLSPIEYLRPALAIPYCHHEKWDGSGYPRGLKNLEIPLAARIFAVIDVWDALNSDRPYRDAWPNEKVLKYIRTQSRSYFDPQVVDAFLKLEGEL